MIDVRRGRPRWSSSARTAENAGPAPAPRPHWGSRLPPSRARTRSPGRGVPAAGASARPGLGQVASDGTEIVAVGSQSGARIGRAQFFVSQNDGRSWAMGSVRAPGRGRAAARPRGPFRGRRPGGVGRHRPRLDLDQPRRPDLDAVAVGRDAPAARRPDQRAAPDGIGFIAVGTNIPGGDQAKSSPVVFLSANGISWQRLGASQLRLPRGHRPRPEHQVRGRGRHPDPDRR
jgi:hypothetical protein